MNHKKVISKIILIFIANLFFLIPFSFDAKENQNKETNISGQSPEVIKGMNLFQGKQRLKNGGPSCVTCHNVQNDNLIPGGLFAKDLTDVYDRMGEGLVGWLGAPPFPAMASSYNNNPLTKEERQSLTAFFKYANEKKETHSQSSGNELFLVGGAIGVLIMLGVIQFIWVKRKRRMVKEGIFNRQVKAWDAKF